MSFFFKLLLNLEIFDLFLKKTLVRTRISIPSDKKAIDAAMNKAQYKASSVSEDVYKTSFALQDYSREYISFECKRRIMDEFMDIIEDLVVSNIISNPPRI